MVRSGAEQRCEAGLLKMVVGGEAVPDVQLAHEGETHAISEGPLFVPTPPKETSGGVKAVWANPLQAQGFAAGEGVEKVPRGGVAVPHQQQRHGFVRHIVGGQESAVLPRQFGLKTHGGGVLLVRGIPKGEEPGAVHEHISGGHRRSDQCPGGGSCLWDCAWRGGKYRRKDRGPDRRQQWARSEERR